MSVQLKLVLQFVVKLICDINSTVYDLLLKNEFIPTSTTSNLIHNMTC